MSEDPKIKAMYQDSDEHDECETCGKPGNRIEYGHRWCEKCWQAFVKEYNNYLDSRVAGRTDS